MAGTRFKVENGLLVTGSDSNSIFEHVVGVNANLFVRGDLLYVGNNLFVGGNLVYTNTQVQGDLTPITETGAALGNNTHRFDGSLRIVTVSGNLLPTSNGLFLGNTSRRWEAYTTNISATGTISVAGNTSVSGQTVFSNTLTAGNTTINGFINVSSSAAVSGNLSVTGVSTLTGNVTAIANVAAKGIILDNAAIFSNTATVTNTSINVIDSFPRSQGYFSKLFMSVNAGNTLLHSIEMMLTHDNTNAIVTKYGELYNTRLGTFDATINGANVEVTFAATVANTYTVKTLRQQILA